MPPRGGVTVGVTILTWRQYTGILALLQYCVQEVLPCKSLQSCPVHDWQSHKMHSQDDTRVQVKCLRVLQYFLLPDHLTSHGLQEPGKRLNAHSYR